MLKNRLLLGVVFAVVAFVACEKSKPYDEEGQYVIDEALIKRWADSTKTTLIKDKSRLYYQILKEGTGAAISGLTDTLTVEYTGRLLNDTVFNDSTKTDPYKFLLKNVMPGWQSGLPLIKEGGQIRLLVPSPLAYRQYPIDRIPANSVLHFVIELKKVAKQK
jgi:FKBP-type peptidyl-prolyl cis-trans isomerase FkpA